MAEVIKKNSKLLIIIALITIILVTFYFIQKAPVSRAGEEIRIFPTGSIGTWQKPENAFSQDLEGNDGLELFNQENSTYPQGIKGVYFSPEQRQIIENLIQQPIVEEVQEEMVEEIEEPEIQPEESISAPEPEPELPPAQENEEPEPVSFWQNLKRFFKLLPVFAQEGNATSTPEEENVIQQDEENNLKDEEAGSTLIEERNTIIEDIFELNNFSLGDDFFASGKEIINTQLRISMAGLKINWW